MRKEKSLKLNMVMNMILTASKFVFPLLTYSHVARVLGAEGTGQVAFVFSIISYFSYIAVLGVPAYGTRETAKLRDDKDKFSHLVQELLIINLISTAIAYVLMFVTVLCVPHLGAYSKLFIVMGLYIILQTLGVEWMYQAIEEYTYITVRSIIVKALGVVLIYVFVRDADDILPYGALYIFTDCASNLWNFFNIKKHVSLKKKRKYSLLPHLKPIFTLFAATIIISVYVNFDVTMIGFIKTNDEVGMYNAALKMQNIVLAVSRAVSAVLVPRMVRLFHDKDEQGAREMSLKSVRLSMILTVPITIYSFIFAKDVLLFVAGDGFLPAIPVLRVLMLCIFPLILANLFGSEMLIPSGGEKRYTRTVFITLWINLGMNFLLIPKWGAVGAAIGTFIAELWNIVGMSNGFKDTRKWLIKNMNYIMYLVPLALGSACSIFVGGFVGGLNVFFRLCITAGTFFAVYYVMLLPFREPMVMTQLNNVSKILQKKGILKGKVE